MAQLESNFRNASLVLSVIILIAIAAVTSVHFITNEQIKTTEANRKLATIKAVLPFDVNYIAKAQKLNDGNELIIVHKAYNVKKEFIGAAVESTTNNGFNGKINVMIGFDKNGEILDYTVLQQRETPGMGTKIINWFKTENRNQNIKGKNPGTMNFTVINDGGEIDAITAATISSRAFLFTVRNAYNAFCSSKPECSADTSENKNCKTK